MKLDDGGIRRVISRFDIGLRRALHQTCNWLTTYPNALFRIGFGCGPRYKAALDPLPLFR